jgi:putative methyltransferase (TIGR04325 family)
MIFMSRFLNLVMDIIRQFIPPVALRVVHRSKTSRRQQAITYEGIFDSFEAVIRSYGNQPDYSTDLDRALSKEKLHTLISHYNSRIDLLPNWSSCRFNFFSSFVSGLEFNKIKVLDIGGGYGETYLHLKQATSKVFEYRIFELDFTVDESESEFKDFSEVSFLKSITDLEFSPDVVYFGSSLQYFNEYNSILLTAVDFQPRFIIISDTPMGDIKSFACAQVNMPGIVIPRWVFNKSEIFSLLESEGYRVIHDSANYYPFHNFNNYPSSYQNITHKNIIFTRKF